MIEKYTFWKVCADVWYIGTISILTTHVVVDLQKQPERHATEKDLSQKQNCMLSCRTYVNSLKIERLIIDFCHQIIPHN